MELKRFSFFFSIILFLNPALFSQEAAHQNLTSWDFQDQGLVSLSGEWEIFPGEWVSPLSDREAPAYVKVPSGWGDVQEGTAICTYRYTVDLPLNRKQMGLSLGYIRSAYDLYINGIFVRSVGKIGRNRAEEIPDGRWEYILLPETEGPVEILFHISNFEEREGGLYQTPRLGLIKDLRKKELNHLIIQFFLFGIFFSLAFYHLMLFMFRTKEKAALYFGSFALVLALRVVFVDSSYLAGINNFFGAIPWIWLRKLEYLTVYGLAVLFIPYFYQMFPDRVNRVYGQVVNICSIPYFLMVLFTPLKVYSSFLIAAEVIVLLWCFYSLYILIRLTLDGVWEGQVLVLGMFIMVLCIILDFMASQGIFPFMSVTPFGFFAFLLAQSAVLNRKLVSSFGRVEKLTGKLNSLLDERKKYQALLERRVLERTAELEGAVEEARAADQAKGDFLARMSHEIRTPMNGIMGFAEITRDSEDLDEIRNYTNNIISESEKLLILINQLLDLSRIEAGGVQLEIAPFNMRELLSSIQKMFTPLAAEKHIEFKLEQDFSGQVAALQGDSFRLRQILVNLVGNAIKFTEKGYVRLSAVQTFQSEREQGFLFIIEDTGKGIAEDKKHKIFESFVQEDTSITRQYGGTGLGTAISRSFVELMGGEIGLESEPGMGTSFWFSLKLPVSDTSLKEIERKKVQGGEVRFPGKRVLLAEDYMPNQEVVKNFLKNTSLDLSIVSDGVQACDLLDKQDFDLILLDIHMPRLNGYSVAEYIRQDLKRDCIIVGLTADGYQNVQDKCTEVGMNDFLTKPIRKGKLLECLNHWLTPKDKKNG